MTDDFCLSSEGSYISDDLFDILVCLLHKIKGKDSLSIEKLLDLVFEQYLQDWYIDKRYC